MAGRILSKTCLSVRVMMSSRILNLISTVINASQASNPNWQRQGLNSPTLIAFNLSERTQLICGSWYGGEMKKGIFAVMNYLLPPQGIASYALFGELRQRR